MGGVADRRVDVAGERRLGDLARPVPQPAGSGRAIERAVAGEGELAAGGAGRALVDDAADAGREGRVADAVEDDLGDAALAVACFPGPPRNRRRWSGTRARARVSAASALPSENGTRRRDWAPASSGMLWLMAAPGRRAAAARAAAAAAGGACSRGPSPEASASNQAEPGDATMPASARPAAERSLPAGARARSARRSRQCLCHGDR